MLFSADVTEHVSAVLLGANLNRIAQEDTNVLILGASVNRVGQGI